jgi:hypothetical protein
MFRETLSFGSAAIYFFHDCVWSCLSIHEVLHLALRLPSAAIITVWLSCCNRNLSHESCDMTLPCLLSGWLCSHHTSSRVGLVGPVAGL